MSNETTPAQTAWLPTQTQAIVILVMMVVIASDMPEPIPFWQASWGQAPSVGTCLLIAAVVLALSRFSPFSRRSDTAA